MILLTGEIECNKCRIKLPVIHFSMDKRFTSGLNPTCRKCLSEYKLKMNKRKTKRITRIEPWDADFGSM